MIANLPTTDELVDRLSSLTSPEYVTELLTPSLSHKITPQKSASVGALPNPLRAPRSTWAQIVENAPRSDEREREDFPLTPTSQLDHLLSLRNKKQFESQSIAMWPPRTKLDLAIRRARLLDYIALSRRDGATFEVVRTVLSQTRVGWDVIFVTNLVAATIIFGFKWYSRLSACGAFDSSIDHFTKVAKYINNIGKTSGIDDPDWRTYVECGTITGYRNPPFPGFDVFDESKKLASSGKEHWYLGLKWADVVRAALRMPNPVGTYTTFSQFVQSCKWSTSGASSVGRGTLTLPDGTTTKFKCRKNNVVDFVSLDQLTTDAIASQSQVNTTIVKSELGKIRIAVAGDMYTYLKMAWIDSLLGGTYYEWEGAVHDEDFLSTTKRLNEMLSACAHFFGLPYDFDGFDHQPLTEELVGIVSFLIEVARVVVPPEGLPEFDTIASSIVKGFNDAVLVCRYEGEEATYPVTGGLCSGLFWTARIGDAWNMVVTFLVRQVLKLLTRQDFALNYIKGDDSGVFTKTWQQGVLADLAYKIVGAVGGEGKYSLQAGKMEFLRVWFEHRCDGYPARVLPGLNQRKPWTSEPWTPTMELQAIYNQIRTLRRRVPADRVSAVNLVWRGLRHAWCRSHNLPDAVCWTSTRMGGLGIEPPPDSRHIWKVEPPVPPTPPKSIHVQRTTDTREKILTAYAKEKYKIDVPPEVARTAADSQAAEAITTSNLREAVKTLRESWSESVETTRFKVIKTPLDPLNSCSPFPTFSRRDSELLITMLQTAAPLFGRFPEIAQARSDYSLWGRDSTGMTFRQWLEKFYPAAAAAMGSFHRSWHRSEVLDYLEGKSDSTAVALHPQMTQVFALWLASKTPPGAPRPRGIVWSIAPNLELDVLRCPVSQELYQW